MARMGDEGKAVGCVPPTALLFVALRQRLRSILILCKRHRLTVVGVGPRMSEFLHDIPNFKGSRDPPREPSFLLCDLRAAKAINTRSSIKFPISVIAVTVCAFSRCVLNESRVFVRRFQRNALARPRIH
jgi:hypothetical protein